MSIEATAELAYIPWQRALAEAVRNLDELLRLVGLWPEDLFPALTEPALAQAQQAFPLLVPRGFIARMRYRDPADPLLRQVLPAIEEGFLVPGFSSDPLGERHSVKAPGLLQKYRGRVLLILSPVCAVHCRYCFRREFPYEGTLNVNASAFSFIENDPSLHEVILSGGDPLSVSNARLADIVDRISAIPHVRRLRVHTRIPVVLPERIDPDLIGSLTNTRLKTTIVIHANHANELDQSVAAAVRMAADKGATLLNQSVLLRGVNDSVSALRNLSERLVDIGVIPYYLHMLDKVYGTAHFNVPEEEAARLVWHLAQDLPGYMVPRLVREVEGLPAKIPVDLHPHIQT